MSFDFVQGMLGADLMEEGAFCHFNNPATGEPSYLPGAQRPDGSFDPDKAVGAYVRSIASKAYADYEDRVLRRSVSSNRKARSEAQRQEMILGQMKTEAHERLSVLVTRFQNTSLASPGVWTPSDAEKQAIAKDPHIKPILQQIFDFAADPTNYPGADAGGNAAAD